MSKCPECGSTNTVEHGLIHINLRGQNRIEKKNLECNDCGFNNKNEVDL